MYLVKTIYFPIYIIVFYFVNTIKNIIYDFCTILITACQNPTSSLCKIVVP